MKYIITILLITTLGLFLRLTNLSPHKFYPDSYQSLVVSENISNYGNVVGYLGKEGMLYPDFVMWTRPGYPLAINLFNLFLDNKVLAAQMISLIAGVLSIPLAFLLIKEIFKSRASGLMGALLLALSFNHTVWGGFIFTETLGIFLVLLLLWRLFSKIAVESKLAQVNDLVIGALVSLAFFTRYEYIIWLFTTILLVILNSPKKPWVKILNLSVSFFLVTTILITQFFPVQSLLEIVLNQVQVHLRLAALVFGGIMMMFLGRKFWNKFFNTKVLNLFSNLLIFLVIILASTLLIPNNPLTGIKNFFLMDPLIGVTFLVGMVLMLRDKKYFKLNMFLLFTTMTLYLTYYYINPTMQRYLTHLLPIFLIPASYGLLRMLRYCHSEAAPLLKVRAEEYTPGIIPFASLRVTKVVAILFLVSLFIYQANLTFNGMKSWGGGGSGIE